MNCSVYIFGDPSSGYFAYPDNDSTSAIFKEFANNAETTNQLAIHREGSVMYYAYIRKLDDNGKYIGLCVLINNTIITRLDNLFILLGNIVSQIRANKHGIDTNHYDNIIYVSTKKVVSMLEPSSEKLPPADFSKGKESAQKFCITDDLALFLKSSYSNAYTYIYDTSEKCHATTQDKLAEINKENAGLKEEVKELRYAISVLINENRENEKIIDEFGIRKDIERQRKIKKRYLVATICLSLIILALVFVMRHVTGEISDEFESYREDVREMVYSKVPILINDIELTCDDESGRQIGDYGNPIYDNAKKLYVKVNYDCLLRGDSIDINTKIYRVNRESYPDDYYSYPRGLNVSDYNDATEIFIFDCKHLSSGTYRIEFWFGDICLGRKDFEIKPVQVHANNRPSSKSDWLKSEYNNNLII